MDLEGGLSSSSLASAAEDAVAVDRMDVEAAEILAALAHSNEWAAAATAFSGEFGAKWGCKGRRVRKRVVTSGDESLPSGIGSNPVLAEDQAVVDQEQSPVMSTSVVIESVEAESLHGSHPCTERCTSNGVVRLRQNVTEVEKETCSLHTMLTNKESGWQMIHEQPILFSTVRMMEKDIWEDSPLDEIKGNNALIKPVKIEQNPEYVKSSPTSATNHVSGGVGRSRQNLTEAEKEERRLRRILANRESARQTIHRRKEKELALKEYQSQESTNEHLKAVMAKAMKAEERKICTELKLDHQISGASRNYPYSFYNQHPFPPFCWPSSVTPSHPVQSQYGHQHANFFPSSISSLTNGRFDSFFNQENPVDVNGPKTALYVVPYPWFFTLPYNQSGLHHLPSRGLKDMEDENSVSNCCNAVCSSKPVIKEEKYNSSLPVEVEKGPNNLNCTPAGLPVDGGDQCLFHIKEEVFVPTPLCSAGTSFVAQLENKTNHDVKTEEAPVRAFDFGGALPGADQESTDYTSKKVLDAVAASEARKRRKQLTKLKNLHGRQHTPLSISEKV
ncbi:uncharacterized protein LOC120143011 isoform X2 [Hibiscus syriacus]|uniref:uncharacterized protein LOC120143011 isoform X2 n=1 Tax=Hibiscus syriacus TaxID=106335 RepID=UPI0019216BE4|nr:uncharacterized protein LOC120143011 isoform X2 [Hibiscus syriacus]